MREERPDPGCPEANFLVAEHDRQVALLGAQERGRLAQVIRGNHAQQLAAHIAACARCALYDARCASCGATREGGRHGWMCPAQGAARWRDAWPWNWRSRRGTVAPAPPAPAGNRREQVPTRVTPPVVDRPAPAARRPAPVAVRVDVRAKAYRVLGLAPGAPPADIRAAYRALAKQCHPDKVAHLAPELRAVAERRMAELNIAYERLQRAG